MEASNYGGIENVTQEFLSMIKLPNENGARLNYLFIIPPVVPNHDESYAFPVGAALVCSALKASGRRVFTLNLNYKTDPHKWMKHMSLR